MITRLIALLILFFPLLIDAFASKQVAQLKQDLSSVQEKKRQLRYQIKKTARAARVVLNDLSHVNHKLDDLQDRLQVTNNRLKSNKLEQVKLALELEEASQSLERKKIDAGRRLRQMYMQKEESPVAVLLASRSLGELASRASLMQRIARKDRELFLELKELQAQVRQKKMRQDRLVAEVGHLVTQQKSEQVVLTSVQESKKSLLSELNSRQDELRRQYDELERESEALAAQIRAYQVRTKGTNQQLSPFSGRMSLPVAGAITSGYGSRMHPILKERRMHTGIDFGARTGTPIRAAASGIVISASERGGYGNAVVIDHGGNISTLYAHCSKLYVSAGQRVNRGDVIAAVGSTGLSTGPHLHFEVRVNGSPVNPRRYL